MKYGQLIGKIIKYLPFIALLVFYAISLWQGITKIADGMERSIHIWTGALIINAIIGEICSLIVIERFNILLTGKTTNIVKDILNEDSQDVAVMTNGMVANTFILILIISFYAIYMYTRNQLLLSISIAIGTISAVGTVIYIIVMYIKSKNEQYTIFSKLSNPVFVPTIICLVQFLITRKKLVGFVYSNIYNPRNNICLIITLILLLCYFLAAIFCHFSNIYCLIGFFFKKRDIDKIQKKIDLLEKKEQKREVTLREVTKYIDERAEQVGVVGKWGLAIRFYYIHIKTHIQERIHAVFFLISFIDFRITKRLSRFLNPERIRINGIRFCWSMAVVELLSLDLLLFMHLESDNPCLKFFELLSTVIIIPVLLSWLSELKEKKE